MGFGGRKEGEMGRWMGVVRCGAVRDGAETGHDAGRSGIRIVIR